MNNRRINRTFFIFSCILFAVIFILSFTAFIVSVQQINMSYVNQQLAIASETMRLRLATTVNSEISLVRKMADTPVIRQYFMNPEDHELEARAYLEFDIYQEYFRDKVIFWINDIDKIFFSNMNNPYLVDPDDPESYWYNLTLYRTEQHNLNINYNPDLQQIYLWINVPVFFDQEDGERKPVGMLGTGINLTDFSAFVASAYKEFDINITPYMFNKFNEITSAMDYNLVHNKVHLDDHLGNTGAELIRAANTIIDAGSVNFIYGDNIYLVSSIPAMEWYLAVSYPLPDLLAINMSINVVFFSMLLLILLILVSVNIFIARSENTIAKQNLQLVEANRKAQSASKAKSDFLEKMSHEVRTPMNTINGMTELLLRGQLTDESREYVQDINQASHNLINIINNIPDFFKQESSGNYDDDKEIRFTIPTARILVVDDIENNIKVAEGLLAPYKPIVDICLSSVKAIKMIKQNKYNLVFMDHMMPEMDGVEAVAAIRAWEREQEHSGKPVSKMMENAKHSPKLLEYELSSETHIPIVALTANVVAGMKEMFLEKGFDDLLAKPISVSKLDEIITRWIPVSLRETYILQKPAALREREQAITESKKKLVILADADPVNLQTGKAILSGYCRVATAPSADKLFLLLEKNLPAMIFLNTNLSEVNGDEIEKVLKSRSETKDIPVIFFTNQSNSYGEM